MPAPVGPGFVAEPLHLAVFSESDLTGRAGTSTRDMRRMPSRRRNVVDPLQLRPHDYVVHEQHGVGRFVELVQRTIGTGATAATREYLVIEYASSKRGQPGDRLFVPSDQLDQVTKYVGGEAPTPVQDGRRRLGQDQGPRQEGRQGDRRRAHPAVLARAWRPPGTRSARTPRGSASSRTRSRTSRRPDQAATIDEVKADMEKPIPMDRLVCGDVGYGKTEIAVRAAFKAVQDGKQVAILVPTTLLVQQHLDTFSERYSAFPVTVKALSRFQSPKESKEVVAGLSDGTVDVVIGTHRLITGEVRFKDLGLVVIDEEQRFGVEHKETLKALRTNVDVLAMSATPIPRTLEMAVTGIREMSTLATPPEERHPVLTFVGAYDEKQISAAIRRELLREGQVFYVHNKVDSIERTASRLMELVPEARVAVAHGKMNEHQLEQVIVDFWEKRFDVLVCTTIVETGLDISNANTLILERADLLGLSQLHQLRGRVGRGRERAYSYFLYPPEKPLTETAHDRLQTIAANTDLGAGMAVAMKDLEIRGAGNLLGGEQSGHIEGVGFDLYIRMVGEAVANFRGDVEEELPDVTIELPVDAHIPHDYIAHERLRLEAYRKIAAAADSAALGEVRAELVDRYGAVPAAVDNLFEVAEFRQHVRASGCPTSPRRASSSGSRPSTCRSRRSCGSSGSTRARCSSPPTRTVLVPWPMTARHRRQAGAGPRGHALGPAVHRRGRARGRLRGGVRGHRRVAGTHGRGPYDDPDRRATTREVRRWRCSGVRECGQRVCWSRWRRRPVWRGAPGSPGRRPWSTARRSPRRTSQAALTELAPYFQGVTTTNVLAVLVQEPTVVELAEEKGVGVSDEDAQALLDQVVQQKVAGRHRDVHASRRWRWPATRSRTATSQDLPDAAGDRRRRSTPGCASLDVEVNPRFGSLEDGNQIAAPAAAPVDRRPAGRLDRRRRQHRADARPRRRRPTAT